MDNDTGEKLVQCEECGDEHPVDECSHPPYTSDGEPRYRSVNCCRCGKPTTFDPVYEDLCGSCCRAANE